MTVLTTDTATAIAEQLVDGRTDEQIAASRKAAITELLRKERIELSRADQALRAGKASLYDFHQERAEEYSDAAIALHV